MMSSCFCGNKPEIKTVRRHAGLEETLSVLVLASSRHKCPERRDSGFSGVIKDGLIIKDSFKPPASDSRVGHKRLAVRVAAGGLTLEK